MAYKVFQTCKCLFLYNHKDKAGFEKNLKSKTDFIFIALQTPSLHRVWRFYFVSQKIFLAESCWVKLDP
jgi:hypothetical protein